MSNYTKSTNFASKDTLPTGSALKIVKGTEIDTEFNNIATAVATKADSNSPTLTTPTLTTPTITNPTITGGSVSSLTTDIAVPDGGTGASTFTSGGLLRGNGTSALSVASAADIVTAIGSTAVTKATNIAGGSAGVIPYQSASDTTALLAAGTAGQILQSNGGAAPSWVVAPLSGFSNMAVFTSSGTWTVPTGVTKAKVTVVGGGGGGNGGGGGGGGSSIKVCTGLSGSVSVTVGAGGSVNGSGGTSSFGSYCSASGGGTGSGGSYGGGVGGIGSSGDLNIRGSAGQNGSNPNGTGVIEGNGGPSIMGGGGNAVGGSYGGGGGGSYAGGAGVVIIEY